MGQLDEKHLVDYAKSKSPIAGIQEALAKIKAAFNAPTAGITSRDDIINPYDILDPNIYGHSRRGKAAYESDLAQLLEIQKQQMASYEEWYNSPEQAAIRERAAGLNPDLIGLDQAGEASSVAPSDVVPGANLPTNGEVALGAVNTFISALSAVGSIAQGFAGIPGILAQSENIELQNAQLLRDSITSDIGSLLGTALQSNPDLNLEEWFADDSNFKSIVDTYGSRSNFGSIFSTQRASLLNHHKNAVALQKENAQNLWDYGTIAANPYYSPYQRTLISQLGPFMDTMNRLELSVADFTMLLNDTKTQYINGLDIDTAIDVANSRYQYDSDYFSNLSGSLMAQYDQIIKSFDSSLSSMRSQIYSNLFQDWQSDPNGPGGMTASYFILGQMPSSFMTHATTMGSELISNLRVKLRDFLQEFGINVDGFNVDFSHEEFKEWFNSKIQQRLDSLIESGVD